jgi:hypothetical protein
MENVSTAAGGAAQTELQKMQLSASKKSGQRRAHGSLINAAASEGTGLMACIANNMPRNITR